VLICATPSVGEGEGNAQALASCRKPLPARSFHLAERSASNAERLVTLGVGPSSIFGPQWGHEASSVAKSSLRTTGTPFCLSRPATLAEVRGLRQ